MACTDKMPSSRSSSQWLHPICRAQQCMTIRAAGLTFDGGVAAGASARALSHTDFPLALLKKYLRPSGAVCSVQPGASCPPAGR